MKTGFAGVILLAISAVLSGQPRSAANDWLIVPRTRVGPVTATTVPADIPRLFPGSAVKQDEIELDEGMLEPATLVNPGNASELLAVVWDGKGPGAHPRQIFVCHGRRQAGCRWHLANGIAVDTRLVELETRNGGPFTVAGFGWNYGGNVLSWDGGRLGELDCDMRVVLTLDAERRPNGDYTVAIDSEERRAIQGDHPVASGTPGMRKLNPRVVEILVRFSGPDVRRCR